MPVQEISKNCGATAAEALAYHNENPYRGLEQHGDAWTPPMPDAIHHLQDNKLLTIVRTGHSRNPYDEEHNVILTAWDCFVAATPPGKRVVLAEGSLLPLPSGHPSAIITNHGARGLLRHLAGKDGAKMKSWGQANAKIFNTLLSEDFDADTLLYYATLRHQPQWWRSCKEQGQNQLIPYLYDMWNRYRENFTAEGPAGLTFSSFEASHEKLYSGGFLQCMHDPDFGLEQTATLWETGNEVQKACVAWNIQRDHDLSAAITHHRSSGQHLYVQGGWQHLYVVGEKFTGPDGERLQGTTPGQWVTLPGFWGKVLGVYEPISAADAEPWMGYAGAFLTVDPSEHA